MWKDTTVRRIILPKVEGRWLLGGSAVCLLIAVVAGVFLFSSGPSAVNSVARLVSIASALLFLVLAGLGLYAKRKSG